ncbi:MAG: hypothetical protein GY753_09630, partial [Gammaproteobacteria bacterium]|nr:hypothetical protein [Gammaproteobacteria bacterium]
MSDFQGFEDLNDMPSGAAVKSAASEVSHTCDKCFGTGVFKGVRVHQTKTKCFACNGKGYFKTSKQVRLKAKAQRGARKIEKAAAFAKQHEELFAFLANNRSWNEFAASLLNQLAQRGSLSENQLAAATRMMEKTKATRAAKAKAAPKGVDLGNLSRITELFGSALDSGLKRPRLRLAALVLSVAPASGKNAGYLYVKDDGEYAGKISPEGKFFGLRSARNGVADELVALAKDPLSEAK